MNQVLHIFLDAGFWSTLSALLFFEVFGCFLIHLTFLALVARWTENEFNTGMRIVSTNSVGFQV